MKHKLLLVDDDEGIHFAYTKFFEKRNYEIDAVSSLSEARKAVNVCSYDAVLLDLMLPDGRGNNWIPEVRNRYPGTAILVITGHGDVPVAVEAIKQGADNFLTKPVSLKDLEVMLEKSLEYGSLRQKEEVHRQLRKEKEPYFGQSDKIRHVVELASLATEKDTTVLILGETGTGKGVLGRWIHDHSSRKASSFVEINCSGLKGELFASELFGHAKGAFTSAANDKPGLVEVANGGTLFLDEISEMPQSVQAEFLNVIEHHCYRRLGEVTIRRSNFRLICSCNRDLMQMAQDDLFRKDLFFRINVLPIRIPPLRERMKDLPGLVHHLLNDLSQGNQKVGEEVMQLLLSYDWPGNIRELKNVLERAILLSHGEELKTDHLLNLQIGNDVRLKPDGQVMNLEDMEHYHISRVMDHFDGEARMAAEALGVSLATLYRKLKKISTNR